MSFLSWIIGRGSPNSRCRPLRSGGQTMVGRCLPHPAPRGWMGGSNGVRGRLVGGPSRASAWCWWPRRTLGWAGSATGGADRLNPWSGNAPGAQVTELPGESICGKVHIHQSQLRGLVPAGIPHTHKVTLVIYSQLGCTCSPYSKPLVAPRNIIQVWAGPNIW